MISFYHLKLYYLDRKCFLWVNKEIYVNLTKVILLELAPLWPLLSVWTCIADERMYLLTFFRAVELESEPNGSGSWIFIIIPRNINDKAIFGHSSAFKSNKADHSAIGAEPLMSELWGQRSKSRVVELRIWAKNLTFLKIFILARVL